MAIGRRGLGMLPRIIGQQQYVWEKPLQRFLEDVQASLADGAPVIHGELHSADGIDPLDTPGTPTDVTDGTAVVGSGPAYSYEDHKHGFSILTTKGDLLVFSTGPTRLPGSGTDGWVLTYDSAQAAGVKWAAASGSSGSPSWSVYEVSHTDLQAAALSNDIELFSLPAGSVIHTLNIYHDASFAGGAIASYTLSLGITGALAKFTGLTHNVFQVPGGGIFYYQQQGTSFGLEHMTSATSIRIAAVSTGANLNASTSGHAYVYILSSSML